MSESDESKPVKGKGKEKEENKEKTKDAKDIKDVKDKEKAAKKIHKAIDGLSTEQAGHLLDLNPALAQELVSGSKVDDPNAVADALRRLNLQDIMTGLASSGKNVKDMGAYKFWATQPVPKFGEEGDPNIPFEEGPIETHSIDDVPKTPAPLLAEFDWCEMDLTNEGELKEVWELLNGHYVEDNEAMFRFNYSTSILKW